MLALGAAVLCGGCPKEETQETVRIGVMLSFQGPDSAEYEQALDWVQENINDAGGIAGKRLEFVKIDMYDVSDDELETRAQELIDDPTIMGVVGPEWSDQTWKVAPLFLDAMKPMITPESTAGAISFAYASKKYIWRTVEPDFAQIKIQLYLAARDGAQEVALLTDSGLYGETFFDWFGFFATELNLETKNVVRTDYTYCERDVEEALVNFPDALIAVPGTVSDAVCTVETRDLLSPQTRIIFADGAPFPELITALGYDAEGLEGTAPAADPTSGYREAYIERNGTNPGVFSANIYDAVLLLAYGLERSGGEGGRALVDGIQEVVSGRGELVSWDAEGIAQALALIRDAADPSELPDITGATGPLEYADDYFVDPLSTTYVHWQVQDGEFVDLDYYTTGDTSGAATGMAMSVDSVFSALADERYQNDIGGGDNVTPPPAQTGNWAVIIAASALWKNYRHQADALAQYQLLKANGMTDDRIILIVADDLSDNDDNPEPGVVRNVEGGPNLLEGFSSDAIDYYLEDLTKQDLLDIIAGRGSAELPVTVDSTNTENVYLFWVGHGNTEGLFIHVSESSIAVEDEFILKPEELTATIQDMSTEGRFRRMLIAIETCHSGVMGNNLEDEEIEHVFMMTGAKYSETSKATNYDVDLGIFVADKFAYEFWRIASESPNIPLSQLYSELYTAVLGSHVSAFNGEFFGMTSQIPLSEFITPFTP
ncbi:MAG: C13 family peptidase [bacterium]